uniref:Osteoclast-stimulating factor 1 n=1 Tax=Denticeps clupeoides TaxID=299321 RepID=A0AAY4B1N9_9TELE
MRNMRSYGGRGHFLHLEVVVEYEYEAQHEDELTLRLGDVIKNVRRLDEDGWMEGDLNGRRGVFPDNFVKELRRDSREDAKEPKEAREESPITRRASGNVASLVQRISTYGIPAGGFQPHSQPRGSKKKGKKRQCRVHFEYLPQNEDELELKVGDVIEVAEEVEEGWWSGSMNGKFGLFPSNFVKEMEPGEDAESPDVSDEPDNSASTTPTSPHPGNGVIAQPKKVKGVGFGDIFSQGSVKLKPRTPSEAEEKKEKPIPSLPSGAKPVLPNPTESPKVEGESRAKAKEFCKATYPYEATNQDELDFKEGDVIHILSKDTGEVGWWKGEIGGREGVFPDNFVALISDADKEAATKGSIKQPNKQEAEEKPKKPPPPSKIALKPEVPSSDKKPQLPRPDDRGDKMAPDHKPAKPAAPLVPPKKPIPPPGKGLQRPQSVTGHPKRAEKLLTPSPSTKHNGEVAAPARPKPDVEPTLPSKPKALSGEWVEKNAETGDLMSFDDVSALSEKLSHPTANRPKIPGRRPPSQFSGGHSPSKETSDKVQKVEEDGPSVPKSSDVSKPQPPGPTPSPPVLGRAAESRPRAGGEEEKAAELQELRGQMKDLLLTVELLRTQQTRELEELRSELEEEREKRVLLQMEIENIKKMVQST